MATRWADVSSSSSEDEDERVVQKRSPVRQRLNERNEKREQPPPRAEGRGEPVVGRGNDRRKGRDAHRRDSGEERSGRNSGNSSRDWKAAARAATKEKFFQEKHVMKCKK